MILEFDHVTKSYGALRALDGVSFGVDRDEIVALLGPNGAGKTTAMDVALGLRHADSGSVRLFGGRPHDAAARRRVGATPQESGFPDNLRAGEILAFAASHFAAPRDLDATLDAFGLRDIARSRAGTLSGGQQRRLALALAFVGAPELVVLDEPTTGLDVESRRNLWAELRTAAAGRCVLFTTHYLEEAQALATRVLVLDRGRLLFDGSADALRGRFGGRRVRYSAASGTVDLVTDDADAYVRALVRDGVEFRDLEIAAPTLEEAFLSLTGASK